MSLLRYSKGAILLLISSFLFLLPKLGTSQSYDLDALTNAYNHMFHLEFNQAREQLESLNSTADGQVFALHIENYIDFISIFSSESEQLYIDLKANQSIRIEKLKNNSEAQKKYSNFVQAEILLQWAVLDARFKHYFSAYGATTKAYSLLEKNLKKYPEFILSKKSLAICHSLVGAIPKKYRWGFSLLSGMEGTIGDGIKEIDEVIRWSVKENLPYTEECIIAKTYILLHLANQPEAAKLSLTDSKLDPRTSPVACFIHANIALRTNNAKGAQTILDNYLKIHQRFGIPFLYFMRGLARIQQLDLLAIHDFKLFLEKYEGDNYLKEARQKIAWCHLLAGDQNNYREEMDRLLTIGQKEVGGDQNAEEEAKYKYFPNINLLKIRLLYDGGRCKKAHQLISKMKISEFKELVSKVELTYRKARISQCLGDNISAVVFFNQTILLGQETSAYFSCNAALQTGIIFENQNDKKKAKEYFDLCLSMNPNDYTQSLHSKATAGLKRLSE